MRTKMFTVLAVLAAFVILTLSGCATYGGKGLIPDLKNPSLAVKEKLATKMGDRLTVTVYPVTNDKEVDKYFDEDLLSKGILPVFVEIQNDGEDVSLIAVTLNNGNNTIPAMTSGDIYGVIKRDWVARSTVWLFITYGVGGPVSALATHITNNNIKEDLGVEGDGGKLLKFGKISKGGVSGFLCFRYSQGAQKQKGIIKLIFQKEGRLFEFDFDIS